MGRKRSKTKSTRTVESEKVSSSNSVKKESILVRLLEDNPRFSQIVQKYVITSENLVGGGGGEVLDFSSWHFRSMFIMEATMFNISMVFFFLFFWVINRNVHMRATKGSVIIHKKDLQDELSEDTSTDDDDDDNDEKEDDQKKQRRYYSNSIVRRKSMMERLVSYGIENDDENLDSSIDGIESQEEYFESLPWGRQLQDLLKIETMFFLNEQALTICAKSSEYVTYANGESIFSTDNFDGTLYAVVSGLVEVTFYDFEMPQELLATAENNGSTSKSFTITVGPETLVTNFLALFWGMLHQSSEKHPFRVSARAIVDDTELIRIKPACFASILKDFPVDVFRIIGTVFNRLQRIMVQTMVNTLGLRKDLLPEPKPVKDYVKQLSASIEWKNFHDSMSKEGFCDESELINKAISLFKSRLGMPEEIDSESKAMMRDYAELILFEDGKNLIKSGEKHDSCYFLLRGKMESGILVPNGPEEWSFHVHQVLTQGALIGEHECLTGEVSLTSVRSCPNQANGNMDKFCVLLKLPKHVYNSLIVRYPKALARALDSLLDMISPAVFLLNWTSQWLHVKAAGVVAKKGTKCDGLYVVLNGRLRGRKSDSRNPNSQRSPEEYGRGKVVGEIGILTGASWPFDIYAIRHSEIVKVPVETLLIIINAFPKAGLNFARSISMHVQTVHYDTRRQSKVTTILPPGISGSREVGRNILPSYGLRLNTIAVVPIDCTGIDLDKFCSTLVSGFEKIAPSKLLTKDGMREKLGEKTNRRHNFAMDEFRMVRMMAEAEENNRLVIYKADKNYSWWTRLCIQQADCILLLVNSDRAPSDGKRVEQSLAWAFESMDVRIDLVVVGNQNQAISLDDEDDEYGLYDEEISVSDRLNDWSEQRRWISGHHIVRAPFSRFKLDFQRLCRRVTGRAIGLVLGAGGARGLAHLGVIRALQEEGVTVDLVGGTSQGAFVGALYAKQPDDLDAVIHESRKMAEGMSSFTTKLLDLTLPMTSIFSGHMFNRGIRKRLGKIRIQDLVLNFFCNSVDLQKQKGVIHTKGLLWKYVRASMSLTGYLPPIAENGQLLVDGAYMNALPADIMRYEMGASVVIGIDTNGESEREHYMWGNQLNGWWVLWNSLNPFAKTVKVPSMGDLSYMLSWCSSEKHRRDSRRICDLYLKPPVSYIGTLEYDKFDEIIEQSYIYSKDIIRTWVKDNPSLFPDHPSIEYNE